MALLERNDTGAVAHLQMNAPERLNALSDEMLAALQAQFDSLKEDRAIRAVILSGAGKAFCAGHDLKQMTAGRQAEDGGRVYFRDLFERCAAMMLSIRDLPFRPPQSQLLGVAFRGGQEAGRPLVVSEHAGSLPDQLHSFDHPGAGITVAPMRERFLSPLQSDRGLSTLQIDIAEE